MNRVIEFRVWDEGYKQMYYAKNGYAPVSYFGLSNSDLVASTMANKHHLMQFSGLTDKNGRKIFEGDIVKIDWSGRLYDSQYTGKIIFKEGQFMIDNIKDTEHNSPMCEYLPHNSIVLSHHQLFDVLSSTYISNYGEVFTFSENLTKCEIIGNLYENPDLCS